MPDMNENAETQQEYFGKVRLETDYKDLSMRLYKRIAELEAQIEKMKCCENCAWWYKLPNGQRDCAETCENRDNWSLRR